MKETRRLFAIFAVAGVIAGLAYWFYLYMSDPDNAPTALDFVETVKSYFSRGYLIASGTVQDVTGTSDYMTKATALIARLEGFEPRIYNDNGHPAIGYGHDIQPGDPYDSTTELSNSDALALLSSDLQTYDDCISNAVQTALTDNQRAALLSWTYNEGCGALRSSTLLKYINAGDFESAADEFSKWIYSTDPATGQKVQNATLISRRETEQGVFTS